VKYRKQIKIQHLQQIAITIILETFPSRDSVLQHPKCTFSTIATGAIGWRQTFGCLHLELQVFIHTLKSQHKVQNKATMIWLITKDLLWAGCRTEPGARTWIEWQRSVSYWGWSRGWRRGRRGTTRRGWRTPLAPPPQRTWTLGPGTSAHSTDQVMRLGVGSSTR